MSATVRRYFVSKEMKGVLLCDTKHKAGRICGRLHEVPPDALWRGEVVHALRGEFFIALRKARKEFARATKRWNERRRKLSELSPGAAFSKYVAKLRSDHAKALPVFAFEWKAEASVAGKA